MIVIILSALVWERTNAVRLTGWWSRHPSQNSCLIPVHCSWGKNGCHRHHNLPDPCLCRPVSSHSAFLLDELPLILKLSCTKYELFLLLNMNLLLKKKHGIVRHAQWEECWHAPECSCECFLRDLSLSLLCDTTESVSVSSFTPCRLPAAYSLQ